MGSSETGILEIDGGTFSRIKRGIVIMSRIIEVFESKVDLLKGDGVSEEAITAAEKKLNLSFSNEYREYLRRYGIVAFDGHELTGIVDNDPLVDVVAVTTAEKEKNKEIPADFYVIEETGVDEMIIWQSGDGKVYCSSPNSAVKLIYNSLVDYITG